MWFIKNSEGEITYLKPNKLMIVSRKEDYDIVLKNDASISKLHASITVRPRVHFKHNEPSSTVIVQDTGSKYGTFVIDGNNRPRKLTPGDHEVTSTDKIKFGLQHHIFTLHYVPLIISTSTLNTNEKAELRNIVDTLDGVIVEKWEEYCTHLTVSNVTLTAQVVQALAFGTPIVELKYWLAVLKSVQKNEELPDTSNYIAIINEGLINKESVSLKTNAERKILFKNLVFVCFSNSQYSLKDIIKCAGGKLKLFKEEEFDLKQLCSENYVLLQFANNSSLPSEADITSYDLIQRSLQRKKLRLIPESEIFLAILYCSTEKYCNPKYDFKRLLSSKEKNRTALSSTILAADTEDVLSAVKNIPALIINESLTASEQFGEQESQRSKQRKLSLQRKLPLSKARDSAQLILANKKILERQNLGSEESSREDALMIDETRSSIESDSNDVNNEGLDNGKEFDEPDKISASNFTNRRFNLQSKLQTTSKIPKENSEKKETRAQSSKGNFISDFYSNPSTSKDTPLKKTHDFISEHDLSEEEETVAQKRVKNVPDPKPKEKSLESEIMPRRRTDTIEVKKTSSSVIVNPVSKLPKRNRMDEDDIFSFVNEGAAKRQKNIRGNDGDNFFELLEDPESKNSGQEKKNIFKKELNKIQKPQIKRRRSSVSSVESSSEDEKPNIKIEKVDTDDETDHAPLIRCKKEFDSSMNEACKSSIISLLRTDIDLTLDETETNTKTFVKVYNLIPQQRIKLKDMYVWKSQDETIKLKSQEEDSTSSEDDDNDFRFESRAVPAKGRGRK